MYNTNYYLSRGGEFFSFTKGLTTKLLFAVPFPSREMAERIKDSLEGYYEIIPMEPEEYVPILKSEMNPVSMIAMEALGDYLKRLN